MKHENLFLPLLQQPHGGSQGPGPNPVCVCEHLAAQAAEAATTYANAQ